jgi:hypothetical protein
MILLQILFFNPSQVSISFYNNNIEGDVIKFEEHAIEEHHVLRRQLTNFKK